MGASVSSASSFAGGLVDLGVGPGQPFRDMVAFIVSFGGTRRSAPRGSRDIATGEAPRLPGISVASAARYAAIGSCSKKMASPIAEIVSGRPGAGRCATASRHACSRSQN
jgi:hypothetical protein